MQFPRKYFDYLTSSNILIKLFDGDILREIDFNSIIIWDYPKLKQIHWNTFRKQTKNIQDFNILYNLLKLISISKTKNEIFRLINPLVFCEEIEIYSFDKRLKPLKSNVLKI